MMASAEERTARGQQGFTLIEALIAIAILALVSLSMLGTRTDAIIDATEARNWLIGREQAEMILSELKAGARDRPPEDYREKYDIKGYEGFYYRIVMGEEFISDVESEQTEELTSEEADATRRRNEWQKERDDLRAADRAGKSLYDYREGQRTDQENYRTEGDDALPISEDEFVDVAVFVFFPNVRRGESGESYIVLKARISTLALNGLTPEEAESLDQGAGTGQG